jgi:hypothetical protein
MRVTILPDDNSVSVDGEGYGGLDLSFMDADVHAVQWYDTHGEVERKDPVTKKMTGNEEITSLDQFQQAITAWQAEKDKVAAEVAAAAAAAEAAKIQNTDVVI